MAITLKYAIKKNDLWLQDTEPNEHYCSSAKAPTMGARHDTSEFKAVWGNEPVYFEYRTALNNLRVVMEEERWEDSPPGDVKIVARR